MILRVTLVAARTFNVKLITKDVMSFGPLSSFFCAYVARTSWSHHVHTRQRIRQEALQRLSSFRQRGFSQDSEGEARKARYEVLIVGTRAVLKRCCDLFL